MPKKLRGVTDICICGDNFEEIINKMKSEKVFFFDAHILNEKLYIKTYHKNCRKTFEIANSSGCCAEIISEKGIWFSILPYNKRYGIAIGIILLVILLFMLSNIVLKIEINGNSNVNDERILAVLNANGVGNLSYIPDIDMQNLKRKLHIAFDEFSWVNVSNSGGKLIIDVTEATQKPKMIPITQTCNVVADRDGQIIDIKTFCGSKIINIGDGVRKGDLLISGIVTDKHGKSELVRADGKVKARYSEKAIFYQPLADTEKEEVDMIKTKYFTLWQLDFKPKESSVPAEEYEHIKSTNYMSFFGLNLPFGITHDTYIIYRTENILHTPISAEKLLDEKMKDYEDIYFSKSEIINKSVEKKGNKDGITLYVEYTLEGEIGIKQNIIV